MLSLVSDINISQGSVATFVRCDRIVNESFIANLPKSPPVKFWQLVSIWQSYGQKYSGAIFSGHGCRLFATILTAAQNFLATIWPLIEILRSLVHCWVQLRHASCCFEISVAVWWECPWHSSIDEDRCMADCCVYCRPRRCLRDLQVDTDLSCTPVCVFTIILQYEDHPRLRCRRDQTSNVRTLIHCGLLLQLCRMHSRHITIAYSLNTALTNICDVYRRTVIW